MDTRDIKELEFPKDGNYLNEIFRLQKELLNHYTKIESLPPYPIDLHTKESQILLKDFSARVVEELGEAMESYEKAMGKSSPHIMLSGEERLNHIYNFNEELGDALHFMIELMIYTGIKPESLSDNLDMYMLSCCYDNIRDYHDVTTMVLDISHIPDTDRYLLRGGRTLSNHVKDRMEILLWRVTYHLQLARNSLKNKPWKQSEMLTDEHVYIKHTIHAFKEMLGFFSFVGMEAKDVYVVYYKKNKVNQFRIASKY